MLCNAPASGTQVLDDFGEEHRRTGKWIVYTSADSVFQVAAHEAVVPLEELYAACAAARAMLQGEHGVSRVIARPFVGEPGAWVRTANRRDFSLPPPGPTLLDRLAEHHVPRVGVGKVDDLFAGRGISSIHTATNGEAYGLIESALGTMRRGLLLANVIEFDQTWGHRNDVPGYHGGLLALDRAVPRLLVRGAGGGPRYLYRRSRQRPDDPVHRPLARSRAAAGGGSAGPAGAAGPAPHVRRRRPDGGRFSWCPAALGGHVVSARGLE